MKVLNRPMFRYGGPIKEGIMSGIQEPKRGRVDGPGSYAGNASEVFKNVESGYVRPDYESQVKAESIPSSQIISSDYLNKRFDKKFLLDENARIKENPMDFQFQYMTPERHLNKVDTLIREDILTKPEAKNYEFDKFVSENYADKIAKQKKIFEAAGDKRLNKIYGNERLQGTATAVPGGGDPEMYLKPKTTVEEVINNKNGAMELEQGPDRKEKINTILEGLGYDRAQKNALYDAMIKAGQRISRTGLSADNLVSDVIAETSQSYDKPEKLREAANLMQVQQDLKLEQIKEGKTNQMEESVNYLMSESGGGKSRTEALDIVLKNPKSGGEAFYNAYKEIKDPKKAVDRAVEWAVSRGKYDEPIGRINTKEYKKPSEFFGSKDWKGAGNYILKGTIYQIDAQGNATKIEQYYDSKKDSGWNIFNKDED